MARRIALLTALLLAAWPIATLGQTQPPAQQKMPLGSRPAPDEISPSNTVAFLTTASQDARTEYAAAKLALEKSKDDKVRALAQTVQTDHQNAELQIEQLAKMKKVTLPEEVDPMQITAIQQLQKLSGKTFDRAYAEYMTTSHENAIRLFDEALKSSDADVRNFAAKVRPELQKHLDAAKNLK
jgi:putative membrane protein